MLAWPCPKQTTKLLFCYLHRWEGHTVPNALQHWGEWHRSREWHDKSQCWPCLRWQLSGQQCIKSGTTSHLNSFCFRPANCWLTVIQNRGDTPWPLAYTHRLNFFFSIGRVSAISANLQERVPEREWQIWDPQQVLCSLIFAQDEMKETSRTEFWMKALERHSRVNYHWILIFFPTPVSVVMILRTGQAIKTVLLTRCQFTDRVFSFVWRVRVLWQ